MSHFTKCELPVAMTDMQCLTKAAEKLGCTVLKNANAAGYRGQTQQADLVLKHPQSRYDVAMLKNKEGAYEPHADMMGGEIRNVYGTPESAFGKLVARYGAEKAKKVAKALGHTLYESVDKESGQITHKVVTS